MLPFRVERLVLEESFTRELQEDGLTFEGIQINADGTASMVLAKAKTARRDVTWSCYRSWCTEDNTCAECEAEIARRGEEDEDDEDDDLEDEGA
jgi:7-cyano-7-deazaguanine synthase in queuosine biosynthesis